MKNEQTIETNEVGAELKLQEGAAPEVVEETGEEAPKPAFRKKTAEEIAAKPKRARVQNDDDDIAAVLELRALGESYMKIEERLGWKNSHGNRAWRICQTYTLAAKPETVN